MREPSVHIIYITDNRGNNLDCKVSKILTISVIDKKSSINIIYSTYEIN